MNFEEWLEELKRLEKSGTPATWAISKDGSVFKPGTRAIELGGHVKHIPLPDRGLEDDRLAVGSRNALPILIQAIEDARKVLDWYSSESNYCSDDDGCLIATAWQRNVLGYKARAALSKLDEMVKDVK